MASRGINKVIIVGNLGQDPEVRYTPDGKAITSLSVATSDGWKDKNTGQMQERTEWHRVVIFGGLAPIAGEYLRKGSQVYLEGKLQTRKWQDQNGQDRYTTEVVVDGFGGQMQMLGNNGNSQSDQGYQNQGNQQQANYRQNHGQQQNQNVNHQQNYNPNGQQNQRQGYNQNHQQGGYQQQGQQQNYNQSQQQGQNAPFDDMDDDIPF